MTAQSPTLKRVVLVGQGPAVESCRNHLAPFFRETDAVPVLSGAADLLARGRADLVLILPDVPADETLKYVPRLVSTRPRCAVVVAAPRASVAQAVRLVKAGAADVIAADLTAQTLRRLAEGLAEELGRGRGDHPLYCADCPPGVDIVGRSQDISRALQVLRMVAESRCNPVLISGETGTGKELAARAVHAWRCGEPEKFVAVNCAALTPTLLESELFGHVRGSFTSADRDKTGLFERAGDGTIFLDEISEMAPELQAKLLRVLQERTFRRVGDTEDKRCEATIIASSNRDLPAEIRAGRFRKDLYYRLAVFPIRLAPLRSPQRRSDILLLAEHFLEASAIRRPAPVRGFSGEAEEALLAHDWPGNVRELRNVVERALILETSEEITPASLLFDRPQSEAPEPAAGRRFDDRDAETDPNDFSLETAEREFILRALKETGWQRTRAAALLGITRATLHAKLKRYEIEPPPAQSRKAPSQSTKRGVGV